jgi:hypothetical protein
LTLWAAESSNVWQWKLDEFRIYNSALSDLEIKELYNSVK